MSMAECLELCYRYQRYQVVCWHVKCQWPSVWNYVTVISVIRLCVGTLNVNGRVFGTMLPLSALSGCVLDR